MCTTAGTYDGDESREAMAGICAMGYARVGPLVASGRNLRGGQQADDPKKIGANIQPDNERPLVHPRFAICARCHRSHSRAKGWLRARCSRSTWRWCAGPPPHTHPALDLGPGPGPGLGVGSVGCGELANPPSRQYLEENAHLIEAILQNQNLGRLKECVHYQQQLQQNLIFLATHADDHPELRPLIFAPTSVAPERPAAGEEAAEAVAGAEARAEATQEAEPAAADPSSLESMVLEARERGKRRARPP